MNTGKPKWVSRGYWITTPETAPRYIIVSGRVRWALEALIDAGEKGCTAIDTPGPRWSHYVWVLRHECGVSVETITEQHGGPFSGTHARYVLRSVVERASEAAA